MKVALVNTMAPFVRGGAEILVDDLLEQLLIRQHEVDLYRIPFPNNYEVPLLETTLGASMLRFDDYDRVIAFKYPAYCIKHPNRVMWMFHQFRQVYELYDKPYGLIDSDIGKALKSTISNIDNNVIPRSRHIYTNAREVTNRLWSYNQIKSEVLNPPLLNMDDYYCGETGDYIYYPSRINSIKRQHLAVEAMKYVKSDVKLIITGKSEDENYTNQLESIIKINKLQNKVQIENRWVSDKDKLDYLANSLAVMYIPYKEDSCGFVTMEGFYSSKPVISCTDSGGTVEFIDDNVTGLFAESDPKDIAKKMDQIYQNRDITIQMGIAAREEIIRRNINWDETIRRLLL
jgi:glycosyltransferase involved in cell wall biosynthesis